MSRTDTARFTDVHVWPSRVRKQCNNAGVAQKLQCLPSIGEKRLSLTRAFQRHFQCMFREGVDNLADESRKSHVTSIAVCSKSGMDQTSKRSHDAVHAVGVGNPPTNPWHAQLLCYANTLDELHDPSPTSRPSLCPRMGDHTPPSALRLGAVAHTPQTPTVTRPPQRGESTH